MSRPWENIAPPPWEQQQPLYDRTVAVHRSKTNAVSGAGAQQIGLTGYSGREQSTAASDTEGEMVLFINLPASIQAKRAGRFMAGLVPSDITQKPQWAIIIPASALPQYSIRDRDIIVDDEAYRYEVAQNYWTAFGYQLECVRLET